MYNIVQQKRNMKLDVTADLSLLLNNQFVNCGNPASSVMLLDTFLHESFFHIAILHSLTLKYFVL